MPFLTDSSEAIHVMSNPRMCVLKRFWEQKEMIVGPLKENPVNGDCADRQPCQCIMMIMLAFVKLDRFSFECDVCRTFVCHYRLI